MHDDKAAVDVHFIHSQKNLNTKLTMTKLGKNSCKNIPNQRNLKK